MEQGGASVCVCVGGGITDLSQSITSSEIVKGIGSLDVDLN